MTTTTDEMAIDPVAESGDNITARGHANLRALIWAMCFASTAFQQAIVPLLPEYSRRFSLSGVQTGMLLAATALSTMAVSLPAGTLSDRLGARRITVFAGWLMALAMVFEAFAPSFSALLFARLVFGAGYGIVWTAGLAWLAGVSEHGSGIGGTVAAAGVGSVLGPLVGGGLAGFVGLAAPFVAAAALFVVLAAALSLARLPLPESSPAPSSLRGSASGILHNRNIVAATAAVVISGLTWSVVYLVGPQELRGAGISTASIGLVLSLAATIFVLGSVLTTSLGGRAVRIRSILVAIGVAALAFVPGMLSAAPLAVMAVICFSAVARSVLWAVCYRLAARGAERMGVGVGVVMGFLQSVWAATSVISPLAAGMLSGMASPASVFALTCVACIGTLGVTAAWIMRHPLRARLRIALERVNVGG
jgi:MFS family permease